MSENSADRYFSQENENTPKILKYSVNGEWKESKTEKYMDCFNPSTGEVIAKAPCCTKDEVEAAIAAAQAAYAGSFRASSRAFSNVPSGSI